MAKKLSKLERIAIISTFSLAAATSLIQGCTNPNQKVKQESKQSQTNIWYESNTPKYVEIDNKFYKVEENQKVKYGALDLCTNLSDKYNHNFLEKIVIGINKNKLYNGNGPFRNDRVYNKIGQEVENPDLDNLKKY